MKIQRNSPLLRWGLWDFMNATGCPLASLMESCLGDLHLNWCIIYLDDIIVFAENPDEHIKRLRGVFQKLPDAGLKLKPSKCEFFKSHINYLGHIVSAGGIECDPKKIEAVKNWPVP